MLSYIKIFYLFLVVDPDKLSGSLWDSGVLPAAVVNSREHGGVLLLADKTHLFTTSSANDASRNTDERHRSRKIKKGKLAC